MSYVRRNMTVKGKLVHDKQKLYRECKTTGVNVKSPVMHVLCRIAIFQRARMERACMRDLCFTACVTPPPPPPKGEKKNYCSSEQNTNTNTFHQFLLVLRSNIENRQRHRPTVKSRKFKSFAMLWGRVPCLFKPQKELNRVISNVRVIGMSSAEHMKK